LVILLKNDAVHLQRRVIITKIIFISLNHTSVSLVKASRRRRGALRKSAKTNKDILP